MEGAREARRRRMMERGSDRLAFITGVAQSLPTANQEEYPQRHRPPRSPAAPVGEDGAIGLESPNYQASKQSVGSTVENDASTVEYDAGKQLLPKCETNTEFATHETSEEFPKCRMGKEFRKPDRKVDASTDAQNNATTTEPSTTSIDHRSSDQEVDLAPCTAAPQMARQIFTSGQINHSISASENIRIICAVTIAFLVVLSEHGYLLGSSVVGSIISFRPLFLVLLTDAAIIVGWLMIIEGSDLVVGEETKKKTGPTDNFGRTVEVTMVLQKALRAAFMDCSICAVFMISILSCSLSFCHFL